MKFLFCSMLVIVFPLTSWGVTLDSYDCKKSEISFDDGDSFGCDSEQIRILGIDAPEIMHKEHGIFVDQPFGREAAQFTKQLLMDAKRVVIIRGNKDKYGRRLAHVLIDGELLAIKLIQRGLAHETVSQYGTNGFLEFSLAIKEASLAGPRPQFENPYKWRKKNQKRPYLS